MAASEPPSTEDADVVILFVFLDVTIGSLWALRALKSGYKPDYVRLTPAIAAVLALLCYRDDQ